MIEPPIDPPRDTRMDLQDATLEREPLDAALIERATQIIRQVVKGNGISARQIKPHEVEGEVLNFEGLAYFKIEAKTSEKRVAGKEKGIVVGNASEMRAKIQNEIEKATHNPDVRRHTIQVLRKRPDLGVLVNNQYITLERLRQVFVVHEACGSCGHHGKMTCQPCAGKGRMPCRKCHGTKEMVCTLCRGTKVIAGAQGAKKNCTRCMARGRIACTQCRRSGFEQCQQCKGSGSSSCQNCQGTGWHSLIGTLDVKAKSRFDFDREALTAPPHGRAELPKRLEEMGPRIVTAKHMQAAIIENEERWKQLEQISKPDEYILPYHLRLPVGTISFALNPKKNVTAKLFGFLPVLEEMPPFLEKPLGPAFKALEQAAAGRAAGLREAMRARFVTETVLMALRHTQKKTLRLLQQRYPVGISEERMVKTIQQAAQVMGAVIKGPRRMGMLLGAVLAAVIYAAFYIGPGLTTVRDLMTVRGLPEMASYAVDMVVFLAGLAVAIGVAQHWARTGVKKALGKLAAQVPRQQLAPSAMGPLVTGMVVTVMLYAVSVAGAHVMGKASPVWFDKMRAAIIGADVTGQEKTAAQGTE